MTTLTFDASDGADTSAREASEANALEQGERITAAQDDAQQSTYDAAKEADAEQAQYAGKYNSAEALEKAYLELQKKLGDNTEPNDPEATSEEPVEGTDEEVVEEQEQDGPSPAFVALQDASTEFDTGGELSAETLEKLSAMDSKTLIENWVDYVNSNKDSSELPQADVENVYSAVGGKNQYNQMLGWASTNLPPNEVAAYDAVMASGNSDAVYWAAQGLKARYEGSMGSEGRAVSGSKGAKPAKGFRSQAELARAIGDSRYRNDPAYRMDVENKLAASGDLL